MGYSRQGKAARLVPVEAGLLRDRGGQLTARRRTARDCSPRHCDRALSSGPWLPWLVSAASRARRGGVLDFHLVSEVELHRQHVSVSRPRERASGGAATATARERAPWQERQERVVQVARTRNKKCTSARNMICKYKARNNIRLNDVQWSQCVSGLYRNSSVPAMIDA